MKKNLLLDIRDLQVRKNFKFILVVNIDIHKVPLSLT
jgi:hypothetical protein